jgi:transcription elongation factor Elf1
VARETETTYFGTVKSKGMNEQIVCKNCGLIDDYREQPNGPHVELICNGCDKHIKFASQNKPFTDETPMKFGKAHKGVPLGQVPSSYLSWVLDNTFNAPVKLYNYIRIRLNQEK